MLEAAVREARYASCRAQGRFALLATVGSRAYGTNHPASDWDFKGVYVASHARMFSLLGAQQTLTPKNGEDMTVYELAHFCKLAAAANPTVLETLWADEYEASELGERLRAHRDIFLSKRILTTYGGYAKGQIKKLQDGTGSSRGADHYKRRKFRLHTARLLASGAHALNYGEVLVRLQPHQIEALNYIADCDDRRFERWIDSLFRIMDGAATRSKLPDEPDTRAIDRLMYSMRQSMLP